MNQKIKELGGLALDIAVPETWTNLSPAQLEKFSNEFAQLIIKECIAVVEKTPTHCAYTTYDYSTVICTVSKSVEILKIEFGLPL